MALPKINVPINEIEQPSTGNMLKFRPFLVKEEKILMMANESGEEKDRIQALKQIINNCCLEEDFHVEKSPIFDIEYFFLKLREISVGSIIELYLQHPNGINDKKEKCDHQQLSQIDISEAKIVRNQNHSNKIKLTDDFTLEMIYPRMDIIEKLSNFNLNESDTILRLISECTLKLYTKDEIYDFREYTPDEKMEFYGNLTQQQFIKLKDFFDTVPKIEIEVNYVCEKCGGHEKSIINGISSFL